MVSKRIIKKAPAKRAVKVEDSSLRNYELVYVIRPDIAEDNLGTVIEKVNQMITGKSGTITGTEKWGKRKLAYPIKHFLEGNYILNRFQVQPKASKELESYLQISEEILRYLVISNS